MTVKAQHSAATVEHGTPVEIVEMARRVLGNIHGDPFSSAYWNEHVVKAANFWDERHSLLSYKSVRFGAGLTWLVNPPGGLVKDAWQFAVERYGEGSAVFWVGFSLEQLVYLGRKGVMFKGFRRCVPPRRLAFLRMVEGGPPVPGTSPTHGNYLLLMPSGPEQVERFDAEARELGVEAF